MNYKEKLEEQTRFKFQTDVWEEFTKIEKSENNYEDIEELYRKYFREWHNDVKMITELSMCMNRKLWEHYEAGDEEIARLYNDLWLKVHSYANDVFIWEDWKYYFNTTD